MQTQTFDQQRAEAFAERLAGSINGAGTVLMISIGHRTGLFDALDRLGSAVAAELAREAGKDERYVREWLGCMVAAGIVELDRTTERYVLPPEHAAFLTRKSTPDNIAATCQWIGVLGAVEDRIVECFDRGGGVPYEAFDRFHTVMAEESAQTVVAALEEHIVPLIAGLTDQLEAGIDVLEVGCGSGRALNHLARRFPNSRFTGYDLCEETIATARAEASEHGLTNVTFERRDVATLDDESAFDLVLAFDAIHDQARPDVVLAGIRRALRSDGTFLMQDIKAHSHHGDNVDHPLGAFIYAISCMHCMTVSLSQGGMGLGAAWGRETAQRMLAEAGFGAAEVTELDHDPINDYYVARPA